LRSLQTRNLFAVRRPRLPVQGRNLLRCCRTLFATHYHELTGLAAKLADLACHSMWVKEWQGDVVFLHEVAPVAQQMTPGQLREATDAAQKLLGDLAPWTL
jgi:hypothetical protein